MSDWFFMLGEPLGDSERELARGYLSGLGIDEPAPIEGVADFVAASRIVSHPDWDRRWWDAEQRERERLRAQVASDRDPSQTLRALSPGPEQAAIAHGAAAVQAARIGGSDPGLIRAAAGALGEALYLAKLAELAFEAPSHPFSRKLELFAGGHWPLGLVRGHYYVF